MTDPLTGRGFLLVGAANGIGFETAALLVSKGAKVAVIDRDAEALARAGRVLGEGLLAAITADLLDDGGIDAAVDQAATRLGRLDGLVNCAAVDLEKPAEAVTDGEWDRLYAINRRAPMRICRSTFPFLKAAAKAAAGREELGGASVVNIASAAGLSPLRNRAAYCSSKAGLIMMSKALAMEWAPSGIRVNAVCPGAVDTALFRTSYEDGPEPEAMLQRIRERYALQRVAQPRELAEAIAFLCSPASSFVTGVAFAVDGGRSFH